MRYSPKNYALAISQSLESNPRERDKIIKNFVHLLKKNRDLNLTPKIEEELKNILVKKRGGRRIKIELARNLPESETKKIASRFSEKDWLETSINPLLIAGVRVTIDGELELDNSLARKLHKLFK